MRNDFGLVVGIEVEAMLYAQASNCIQARIFAWRDGEELSLRTSRLRRGQLSGIGLPRRVVECLGADLTDVNSIADMNETNLDTFGDSLRQAA